MPLNGNMFTQRVPIQFISDDAPGLSITKTQNVLANNPSALKVMTGSSAKVDQDLMGIPHIRGAVECAPFAIQLEWKELGYNDYANLAALRPYFVTFVTFRNIGYYGKLIMDGPESVMSSSDLVHATGNFYPVSPSDDGGAQSVTRQADPTTFAVPGDNGNNSGGINAQQWYFFTFSTEYGETNPAGPYGYNPSNTNVSINLIWTWPSDNHVQYATIYSCSDLSGDNPRVAAEVPASQSAGWTDYVGYAGLTIDQALPTASKAYKGTWNGAIWING